MAHKQVEAVELPPLTPEQFRATLEFRKFKGIIRRLLKVPKAELDERVRSAKAVSPRMGNSNAAGRKPKTHEGK